MGCGSITSVLLLPKTYNLNPLTRKHYRNPNEAESDQNTGQHSLRRYHEKRVKTTEPIQTAKDQDKITNVTWGPGWNSRAEKGHLGENW